MILTLGLCSKPIAILCAVILTIGNILRSVAVTDCARSYILDVATFLGASGLAISFMLLLLCLCRMADKSNERAQLSTDQKPQNQSMVKFLILLVCVLYSVELIMSCSEIGPFCARHLSPELASGWTYATSIIFLLLSIGSSRLKVQIQRIRDVNEV